MIKANVEPPTERPVIITARDAVFITTALQSYVSLVDRLAEAVDTTPLDADVRDRMEQVLLALDTPAR